MNETKTNSISYTPTTSTSSLLGILFITLKLTGYIDWSWLWVLSPFWIPFALLIGFLVIFLVAIGVFAGVTALVTYLNNR